jgi:hypothetical protein
MGAPSLFKLLPLKPHFSTTVFPSSIRNRSHFQSSHFNPFQYSSSFKPSRKPTNPSLIFITVFVNGTRLRTMVDTGASRSFIALRALGRLCHSKLNSDKSIAQLGDGHTTIEILGEVRLSIKFGDAFTPVHAFVVKTLNTDFILGGDWCSAHGARIDYDTNQVSIRSFRKRISVPYDKNIDHLTLTLKLINLITIPPREACVVQAKLELSSADTVYFYPDFNIQHDKSIVMSPSLLNVKNYKTYLKIFNPTEHTQTLPVNSLLGRVTHTITY